VIFATLARERPSTEGAVGASAQALTTTDRAQAMRHKKDRFMASLAEGTADRLIVISTVRGVSTSRVINPHATRRRSLKRQPENDFRKTVFARKELVMQCGEHLVTRIRYNRPQ
jgi:hypothetical protein